MSDWVNVASESELSDGQRRVVDVDDVMVAVFNHGGEYYAIEDVCTHDGGELASGDLEGDEIICPRHGARFCIRNGEALTAPAYEDVHCFPVRVDNGTVQVCDDRFD
ncbi:non-heme iron oxygenase ferredoxin subunit [Salinisphaera sp. USBA-960]|uniref:non-heme iron oxygenase ferredoxin subunit n=1 Tax=Salinisphaera orenii TaxID=856731 RepID=UPI000DBE5E45|nr:non-heme iron oxygenase ferredoxin subunit [Salifodinibacter halophilus]NNC26369.1 non-heme iron oxygenase ferredoxin subunit [Salifodinibacter halophilus]